MLTYLAGRMGRAHRDRQWRREMTVFLRKLKISSLDPYKMEPEQIGRIHLPHGIKHWTDLGGSRNPEHKARYLELMRKIIRYDINLVCKVTDFVIVYWTRSCRSGAGTHAECTAAFLAAKPVYIVVAADAELPAWIRATATKVFPSFRELRRFLLLTYLPPNETT